jgi:hypothetical protein
MIATGTTLSDQDRRLREKTQDRQLVNRVVEGTGASPWEAEIFVDVARQVYFAAPEDQPLRSGQMRYECVATGEPAGKPVEKCRLQTVVLTLQAGEDLAIRGKEGHAGLRRHLLLRLTEEAREQGGLLSQEDLARLLFTDVRTIRRDVQGFRKAEIVVATRGTIQDIGPGVTHRGIAIKHWLGGSEPVEVAKKIHHSLTATERYIQHFSRVVYLRQKGFNSLQIALTLGISSASTQTYLEIYQTHLPRAEFRARFEEIELVGQSHFEAEDLKKGAPSLNKKRKREGRQP